MPRSMSSAMLTAIQATELRPALFVEAHFATGVAYIWSGYGTISWNGQSWLGVGSLLGVSVIDESVTIEAKGITLTLSGIDQSLLADALQEFQVGAPALVYLGLFDGSTSPPTLIADPITSWAGKMDQPVIDVGGESATIAINCENRLLLMNVASDHRYTLQDPGITPGDLGFSFVDSIQSMQIYFGRVPAGITPL